jgi:hypothetical protein
MSYQRSDNTNSDSAESNKTSLAHHRSGSDVGLDSNRRKSDAYYSCMYYMGRALHSLETNFDFQLTHIICISQMIADNDGVAIGDEESGRADLTYTRSNSMTYSIIHTYRSYHIISCNQLVNEIVRNNRRFMGSNTLSMAMVTNDYCIAARYFDYRYCCSSRSWSVCAPPAHICPHTHTHTHTHTHRERERDHHMQYHPTPYNLFTLCWVVGSPSSEWPRNVILLIPDGTGFASLTMARVCKGTSLSLDSILLGSVKTYVNILILTYCCSLLIRNGYGGLYLISL